MLNYSEYIKSPLFLEDRIISEIDEFLKINEGIKDWGNKIVSSSATLLLKILKFFEKATEFSKRFLESISNFLSKLITKLPKDKEKKFHKSMNEFSSQILNTLQNQLDEDEIKDAINIALKRAEEENIISPPT